MQADNIRPYIPSPRSDIIMYYYNVNGAALASLTPLEGLGPEVEPSNSWRLFAAVPGDPVLGRGSFKVNHPGQLLAGHGLETLDASRLPCFDNGPVAAALSDGTTVPLERDETVRQAIEDLRIPHDPKTSEWVTVSVGGVTIVPPPDGSYASYLKVADTMLYDAKRAGRTRVVWANEHLAPLWEK